MSVFIIGVDAECDGADSAPDHESALENGYIAEGSASAKIGVGWYDSSNGTCYGGGRRFDHEETPFMAKVRSKND